MKSLLGLVLSVIFIGVVGITVTGCEDDDDNSQASGGSVIQGNVAGGSLVTVAGASKNLGGITVSINGLSIQTTTAADGSFILTGVPAGSWNLTITINGKKVSYPVTVGENEKVILSNIVVSDDGSVSVGSIVTAPIVGEDSASTEDEDNDGDQGTKLKSISITPHGSWEPQFSSDGGAFEYYEDGTPRSVDSGGETGFEITPTAYNNDVRIFVDGTLVNSGDSYRSEVKAGSNYSLIIIVKPKADDVKKDLGVDPGDSQYNITLYAKPLPTED